MKNTQQILQHKQSGFTVLFAIIVAAAIAILGSGIYSITSRQAQITTTEQGSRAAYSVADAATECALYQIGVEDAFGDGSLTTCNGQSLSASAASGSFEWQFSLSNLGANGQGCATVYIDTDFADNTYQIRADGIDDCSTITAAGIESNEVQLITELEIGKTLETQGDPLTLNFTPGSYSNLGTKGTCVYAGNMWIARGSAGFEQLDVSDPTNITSVRTISTTEPAVMCAVYESKLYLGHDPAVEIYSLADPDNPTYESTYWTSTQYPNPYFGGDLEHVALDNGYMYVSLNTGGIDIVRLSDLSRQSNFNESGFSAYWVAGDGNYIYAYGVGNANIRSIDVSDKTNASIVDDFCCSYPSTSIVGALFVPEQDIIYWGGHSGGFTGIQGTDVSDPTNMTGVWLGSGKHSQVVGGSGTSFEWQPIARMDGDLLVVRGYDDGASCPAVRVYDVSGFPNNDIPYVEAELLSSTIDMGDPMIEGFDTYDCEQYGHVSVSGNRIYATIRAHDGRAIIYDFKDKLGSTYQD